MSVSRRAFIQRVAQMGGYSAAYSAMHLLGLIPEVGASPLPDLPADFGRGKRVLILGAGIAGLVSALELRKAGFTVNILEARSRPGGRSWTVRNGSTVEFTDGTKQQCTWEDGQYFNAGPARIPSHHTHLLDYCQQLNVPLEVEINFSRSARMQDAALNGGQAVEQRRVVHDTRGYIAELLSKAISQHALDQDLTQQEAARFLDFLQQFGDLNSNRKYVGSSRAGFAVPRSAGPSNETVHAPLKLAELLAADLSKGEFYEEQIDWQATMFQPIGGMDRIPYGFAKVVGDLITYDAPVQEISTGPNSVTAHYTKGGQPQSITADWCICTLPLSVLTKTKNNFTPATQKAFNGIPLLSLYKIAWESPRFWEKDDRIYGGISFLKDTVDLVWYPSAKLFSPTGVILSGFNLEREPTGSLTEFGKLSRGGKLNASRAAVEKLHPGKSSLLAKPIYISWENIPYSLGCLALNELPGTEAPYKQLDNMEGRTIFAGDYLSHLTGWQQGAILSSHRAIDRIAKAIRG